MKSRKLIVATSNPGKLREMAEYLTELDWELQLKPQELEIAETGTTFLANARLKASEVAKALGEWAIADDSGLAVDALNGAPGIYSARYGKTDTERITRLLTALEDNSQRQAQFICAIAIARPDGSIALETEGVCPGKILTQTLGEGGFGYDPVFLPLNRKRTTAEMSPDEEAAISHRGIAMRKFLDWLKDSQG